MSLLIITPSIGEAVVSATDSAQIKRDRLVAHSAKVTAVSDRIDFDDASETLRALKSFSKEIVAAHQEAKAPVLDVGRKIDQLKKDLVAAVDSEADRISKILGAYEAEERRKAEDERRKADAEIARIAHEAQQKADAARMGNPDPLAAVRASDAVVEKAQSEIVQIRQQQANAVAPKAAGSTLREEIVFEVTDIVALYADSPALVKLEPNNAAIKAIISANPNIILAGITHKRVPKFNVR
jgi:hypothetical protein